MTVVGILDEGRERRATDKESGIYSLTRNEDYDERENPEREEVDTNKKEELDRTSVCLTQKNH